MLLPRSLLQDLALKAHCRHDIVKGGNLWSRGWQEGAAVAVQPVPMALMQAHTKRHYRRPMVFVSLISQGLTRFTFFLPKGAGLPEVSGSANRRQVCVCRQPVHHISQLQLLRCRRSSDGSERTGKVTNVLEIWVAFPPFLQPTGEGWSWPSQSTSCVLISQIPPPRDHASVLLRP